MSESLSEQNYQDLTRATMLLQSDQPRDFVDALYLHGLSEGMLYSTYPNLFDFAEDRAREYVAKFIAFNGSDGEGMPPQDQPGAAWPGKNWYIDELTQYPIFADKLKPTGAGRHTREEADKFISLAKEMGWRSAAILSVPYHSVRSMSCMVAAMETQNHFLEAYFLVAPSTDAWRPMLGSQGVEQTDTFTEIAQKEIPSILRYWERGGANPPDSWRAGYGVPARYLFHYLQYRSGIVDQQKFPLFPLN